LDRSLELVVAMCRADAYGSEARAHGMTCAFPPCHGFPYLGRLSVPGCPARLTAAFACQATAVSILLFTET
jgi:hypothetical protein